MEVRRRIIIPQRVLLIDLYSLLNLGLTLLLPVLINSRSNWSETKLRIFCTASGVQELEKEHKGS